MLGERVEREGDPQAVRVGDLECLEVDRQLVSTGDRRLHLLELVGVELDRSEPRLDRVLVEDVAEARREHELVARVFERPGRMLPRGAAAEVAPGDEDLGALVLGAAQLEQGILHPVVEQELAVPRALDPLQELLRDDLVGVDVGPVEHRRPSGHLP